MTPRQVEYAFREFSSLFLEKFSMQIAIYADETCMHDPAGKQVQGSAIAGVAGYISTPDEWANFCCEWEDVLQRHKVEVFHFAEFANKKNRGEDVSWEYYNWPPEKGQQFLNELARVAHKRTKCCVGAFVCMDDYHKIVPEKLKKQFGHLYHFCFKQFFEVLFETLDAQWNLPDDTQVACFFDQINNPAWRSAIHTIYSGMKFHYDSHDFLGALTFADKQKLRPLQAADLIAYRLQQIFNNNRGKKNNRHKRIDDALGPVIFGRNIRYFDADDLKLYVRQMEGE